MTDETDGGADAEGRRPPWVYVGEDVDPRYSLANERTFLAWIRTVLAVIAGAVALESLQVPETDSLRTVIVLALLAFGVTMALLAFQRWGRTERAMRLHQPLPPFTLGRIMTGGLVLAVVALAVVLIG